MPVKTGIRRVLTKPGVRVAAAIASFPGRRWTSWSGH